MQLLPASSLKLKDGISMDAQVVVAIISAIASITAASLSALAVMFASHAKATAQQTHLLINSRMTELLELTRQSAKAEGVLEGKKSGLEEVTPEP